MPLRLKLNQNFGGFHGCRNRSGRSGPVSICALDRNGQSGPGRCPGRSPDATGSGLSGPVLILQKHYPCPVRPGAIFQNRCPVQSGPERCPAVYWFSPVRCPVRPGAIFQNRCPVQSGPVVVRPCTGFHRSGVRSGRWTILHTTGSGALSGLAWTWRFCSAARIRCARTGTKFIFGLFAWDLLS